MHQPPPGSRAGATPAARRRKGRVVVAMSGGVDSSTAAALLVEAGHEVVGVALKTHAAAPRGSRACCTPDDLRDARRVADVLGIPFYVVDTSEAFAREVVLPFAAAYRRGETPNPCVACNEKIKFAPLLGRARLLGATALATGHYARTERRGGHVWLRRAADRAKDQSYFLYRLGAATLPFVRFPIGALTKAEVRARARALGLPVADKAESQEICFVGAEGYAAVVERLAGGGPPGAFVDGRGTVLGRHPGVHHFTVGQRRGLGLSSPTPLYVIAIDAARGEVQVGPRAALLRRAVTVDAVLWYGPPPAAEATLQVQLRHRDRGHQATLLQWDAAARRATLALATPQGRAAPGQAAVFYDGERVRGGGVVATAAAALPLLAAVADA